MNQSAKLLFIGGLLALTGACRNTPEEATTTPEKSQTLEDSPVITTQLSNQRVTGFAEDADGYIWISTFRGLNRYNGHDFHQYYCGDDSLTLPDNQLNSVFFDSKNRLWVASVNGAAYYTEQDNFHRVKIAPGASQNGVQFVENSQGRLFLNLINSFAVFDEDLNEFTHEVKRHDSMDLYTQRLYIDKNDHLWCACGLSIFEYDSRTLERLDSIPLDHFMGLSCMLNDELWMENGGKFCIYDIQNHCFKPVPQSLKEHTMLQQSAITQIFAVEDRMEIYTPNGAFVYIPQTQQTKHQSDAGFPVEEKAFLPTVAFADSKGNLWMGSQNQGFFVRYVEKQTFNSETGLSALLHDKSVPAVINDGNDNLWIATNQNGVYRYTPKTSEMQHFDLAEYFPGRKKGEADAYSFYIDHAGCLWMLISNGTVGKFRYEGGKLSLLKSYGAFTPLTIYEDKNHTLWIGTYSDLLYYLPEGEDTFRVQRVLNKSFSYTSVIKELRDGTPLALTWDVGVQKINAEDKRLEPVTLNAEDKQLAIKRSVFLPTNLLEDSKGRVWIGTVANGLMCYDPKSGHIESILGTPCTDICSMEEDDKGNIWVSTMNGLSKYDPDTYTFSNFDASDGVGGNQFFDRSSCKLSDGTLVFGGNHGLTVFNPDEALQQKEMPVLFEDLKIHNVLIHPAKGSCIETRLARKPEIRINHKQNGFSISFAALDFSPNEQAHYHYKLDGFDKYWIDARNNHEAYYANVPAGSYTFRVKVTSADQSIVNGENEITVRISPAPWRTWWAYLLYTVLFIGLIWFMVRAYIHIQNAKRDALVAEREKEHELHVNQMNMSFFSNVSHEFRTPLTIISGPIEQLCSDSGIEGENKHLLYIVQRSVRRMLRLVNQMMDFHKLENDTLKLQVKNQDVIVLLQQFADLFTVNAREKDITLNVYGLEDKFMMWCDADKVEKITTNLLSNAFKFTPAGGKITFSFDVISREEAQTQYPLTARDTDSQYIKVSVKDTGKGIPEKETERIFHKYYQLDAQQKGSIQWGTGIGLYYARSLAQLHHGYIKAENRKDQQTGSIFSFILPVSEDSYTGEEHAQSHESQDNLFPLQSLGLIQKEEENKNRQKILVVDDDTEVTHYLRALLAGDYHIICKFDAENGLKSMQEDAPDLVISDVVMPGVSGYEFCRQIKDNQMLCHIPVILVTAKTTTENQIEGLNSGADAYVIKPFDPAYLKALIHSLLQNREKARHILVQSTQTAEVPEEVLSPQDKHFMDELYGIMEKELSNPELDVTHLTELLHISRTKLYYKIKGLTGENPSVFFRCYKLNRASELIREGKYTLSEIADMTGFNSLSHFSTTFKKNFGVTPSEFK